MDLDGVTAIGKIDQVCMSGGIIEKSSVGVQQKLILGDKFGAIHLFDVSRKLALDKIVLPRYTGRRIQSISTATLEWTDTRLTYTAIIARGSPIISIVCFKQNENKLIHFNSINMCPDLENSDQLELNDKQTYLMLPSECKLSLDCEFLQVTNFDGTIVLMKMPSIIDPMAN